MIFLTGDTDFGKPLVLRINRRPFSNMAEHDPLLIRDWNAIVGEDDDVWRIGDFMSAMAGDCSELLASLNGHQHLIVGNNDLETTTNSDG
jgi:calcineurin-like phosphoesterase family protein